MLSNSRPQHRLCRYLEQLAEVQAKDKSGRTALEFALKQGNPEVVKVLQDHGAQ